MIHKDFLCEFYFIRHGESASNASPGFASGVNFDAPLTSKGFDQAQLLGQRLNQENVAFDRVYSSSLTRAVQTTEAMLEAMGRSDMVFTKVDALIEQQFPGWRGVRKEEVYTPAMLAYIRGKRSHFVPPQGESQRMVQRRMANWLEDEIIYNDDLVGKATTITVAIIGHGNATRCLYHYIMGFDEGFISRIGIDNCSISRFVFNKEGWFPICLNDASHINLTDRTHASQLTSLHP